MAYIGLAKPTIAKMDEGGGAKVYSEAFTCGEAIQMDITPQYAEGSLYGDNAKVEYDKEFKYADISFNTTRLPIKAHEIMFGHTVAEEDGTVTFKAADEAGYVGLGFYVDEKAGGARRYTGAWLPKVKFSEGAESYKTKGDNIEYQTPTIAGQALADSEGIWKEVKTFTAKEEAQAWIDTKAGKTAPAENPGA